MKKLLFAFILLTGVFAKDSHAQNSLGIRIAPDGFGFTGKFFKTETIAFEAQANASFYGRDSYAGVGLLEYHIPFSSHPFRFYMGAGGHVGVYVDDNPFFGLDAIAGLEYVFRKAPLGLSIDFKPAVNFIGRNEYFGDNHIGLAARFKL